MADNSLKISYKIYLEAEDISQSRISSTASYVSNLFKNCTNSYLQKAEVDKNRIEKVYIKKPDFPPDESDKQ